MKKKIQLRKSLNKISNRFTYSWLEDKKSEFLSKLLGCFLFMKAASNLIQLFFFFFFRGWTWHSGDSSRNYGFNPSSILRGIIGCKGTPITRASRLRRFEFPCQQPSVVHTRCAPPPSAKLCTRSKHQTGNNSLSDSVCQVAESTPPLEKSPLALQSCPGQKVNRANTCITAVNKWVCFCLHKIPCAAHFGLTCSRKLILRPQ